jgi:dihydrofolate reductase
MRKVFSSLFISLDGVVERPDQWQFAFDDEMGEALSTVLQSADTILLGRVSWQEWSGYWPTATEDKDFADWINNTPKYVASTTLDSVDAWQNSNLVKGDFGAKVRELKESDGGMISVGGSPSLVRWLVEQDLLDELQLLIHPVVAGEGRARLFPDEFGLTKLELVSAQPTSSGVIIAHYRPVR